MSSFESFITTRKFRRGFPNQPTVIAMEGAGSDSVLGCQVTAVCLSGVKALRQGALNVQCTRASDQSDTTWDGNPDTAMLVQSRNTASNSSNSGAVRGASITGRNSGTNINWVLGLNINARNDSGKTANTVGGAELRIENYGTVSTEIVGFNINLSDENSSNDHLKYGLRVRNTDASGMAAVTAAVHTSHTSPNSGFSHFLHAAATGDGVTTGANDALNGLTGTARLLVKVGTTAFYAPLVAV